MRMSDRAFDIVGSPVSSADGTGRAGPARARLFSVAMLCTVTSALGYAGYTAFQAARDSYVAPAILSPDSDIVVAGKLKLAQLADERARAAAEIATIDGMIEADERGAERLRDLQRQLDNAVQWTAQMTSAKASAGAATLQSLRQQKDVVQTMIRSQEQLTEKARADVEAGIISRSDFAKETQVLDQLQIALLDNARATLDSRSTLHEAQLAQRAVAHPSEAPLTPELMAHEEQVIRVELEISHLESEARAKRAEREVVGTRLGELETLAAELRSRPIYQAVEKSLDVAFVPYSQIDGVHQGAAVYDCTWGLFFCKQAGVVAELVPGEVILPDPWGTSARGQYAVLTLWAPEAARSKTLRVRALSRT
jgi:hypothetical protein